jgi:branched-chain amino acid transport system ATP-binding protein
VERLFPRLAERRRQIAATLSGGEQQMLAIGRALMTNPKLLILDEATEGLAPTIRAEIWAALARLKAEGEAILIVDKTLRELLPLADDCVILERGATVWSGPPGDLDSAVSDRFLGV